MKSARVISVNVGLPQIVEANGEPVLTGIFKNPVHGQVVVHELNLEGDRQADLTVHGGHTKAVYVYPAEHYDYWRDQLSGSELTWGNFGENLTTEGLLETDVCTGDRLEIGTAVFIVTTPRFPCYKLGIRFGRKDMVRRFAKSGRTGFYLSVEQIGKLTAGDTITHRQFEGGRTIAEIAAERLKLKT